MRITEKVRTIWPMKRTYLGEFEEIVLLTVAVLEGEAYGVKNTHQIIEQTGRNVRLNQVHAAELAAGGERHGWFKMGKTTAEKKRKEKTPVYHHGVRRTNPGRK